jgi:hypothetical protein
VYLYSVTSQSAVVDFFAAIETEDDHDDDHDHEDEDEDEDEDEEVIPASYPNRNRARPRSILQSCSLSCSSSIFGGDW